MKCFFCYTNGSSSAEIDFPGESTDSLPYKVLDVIRITKEKKPYISKTLVFFDDGCVFSIDPSGDTTEYLRQWAIAQKIYSFDVDTRKEGE